MLDPITKTTVTSADLARDRALCEALLVQLTSRSDPDTNGMRAILREALERRLAKIAAMEAAE